MRSWPAHQLHAWGNRHAEASARVHCNAFASPDDFVEVFSRRYDNLGKHTPVISTGAVVAQGERHELHGALRGLAARATIEPNRYRFTIRGPFLRIEGEVHCALADMVGVSYRDPDGGRVYAYAADHAVIEVEVRRRDGARLVAGGAAVGRQLRLRVRQPDAGAGRRGGAVSAGLSLAPGAAAAAGLGGGAGRRAGVVHLPSRRRLVGPFASLNLGALTADEAANVAENRRRAVAGAGGDGATATMAWQVHGTRHPRGDRQARLGALPAARRRAVPEVGRPGHQQPRPGADAAHRRLPAGRDRGRRRQPAGGAARRLAWHRGWCGRSRRGGGGRPRRWPRSGPGRGRAATRWATTWPAR